MYRSLAKSENTLPNPGGRESIIENSFLSVPQGAPTSCNQLHNRIVAPTRARRKYANRGGRAEYLCFLNVSLTDGGRSQRRRYPGSAAASIKSTSPWQLGCNN